MSRTSRLNPPLGAADLPAVPTVPAYGLSALTVAKWRAALAGVRAGVGHAKLLCIGDSTTQGGNVNGATGLQASYPFQLASLLNSFYAPAANGLAIPFGNVPGYVDTRWTVGSGWVISQPYGWAKTQNFNATTAASGSLVFNPGITCDTFDLYFLRSTGLGTTVATIGGVPTSVVTAGAIGVVKQTITVTAGANTVSFAPPTVGPVYLVGVDAYLSTTKRIRVGNAGVGGTSTVAWAYTGDDFSSSACIRAYAPDLTISMLGINDAAQGTPISGDVWAGHMTTIATAARVSGDFIIVSVPPSQGAALATAELAYRNAARNLCAAQGWPMIDVFMRQGTWAAANTLGLFQDDLHPSARGYADIAGAVFAALTAV